MGPGQLQQHWKILSSFADNIILYPPMRWNRLNQLHSIVPKHNQFIPIDSISFSSQSEVMFAQIWCHFRREKDWRGRQGKIGGKKGVYCCPWWREGGRLWREGQIGCWCDHYNDWKYRSGNRSENWIDLYRGVKTKPKYFLSIRPIYKMVALSKSLRLPVWLLLESSKHSQDNHPSLKNPPSPSHPPKRRRD